MGLKLMMSQMRYPLCHAAPQNILLVEVLGKYHNDKPVNPTSLLTSILGPLLNVHKSRLAYRCCSLLLTCHCLISELDSLLGDTRCDITGTVFLH